VHALQLVADTQREQEAVHWTQTAVLLS